MATQGTQHWCRLSFYTCFINEGKKSTNHTLVYDSIALSWNQVILWVGESFKETWLPDPKRENKSVLHIGRMEYFWANLYYAIIVNINFWITAAYYTKANLEFEYIFNLGKFLLFMLYVMYLFSICNSFSFLIPWTIIIIWIIFLYISQSSTAL